MESLLAAHPDVVGIWCQAGAHASAALKTLQVMGLELVPITGENYNAYLLQWNDLLESGFSSFATAQVNYMAVIALDLAILAKQGQEVPSRVEVPLPEITDENVGEWASTELPEDWYSIPNIPGPAERQAIIEGALAGGEATPTA
jgi:ribose transport system substrate-binding protein